MVSPAKAKQNGLNPVSTYLLGDFSGHSPSWEAIDKEENYFHYEINIISVLKKITTSP